MREILALKGCKRKERESWKPLPGTFLVAYLSGRYASQRCCAGSVETGEKKKRKRKAKRRKEYAIRCAHVQVNRASVYTCVRTRIPRALLTSKLSTNKFRESARVLPQGGVRSFVRSFVMRPRDPRTRWLYLHAL